MRVALLVVLVACSSGTRWTHEAPVASPGVLAQSHEMLACSACHDGNQGAISANKCLGCHVHAALKLSILENEGLHSTAMVRQMPCEQCHRDHRGRAYDIRGWQAFAGGEAGFDHRVWPLEGAHITRCERCHPRVDGQGLRTYLDADRRCTSCHARAHDGHLFGLLPCTDCHAKPIVKKTPRVLHPKFELGAHRKLPCVDCHTKSLGTAAPDPVCHKCHADENPHGDRFETFGPPACGACHVAQSWRLIVFNHKVQTRFDLWPAHADLTCRQCHRGADPTDFEKLSSGNKCRSCHAHANVHADHPDFTERTCKQCHRPVY